MYIRGYVSISDKALSVLKELGYELKEIKVGNTVMDSVWVHDSFELKDEHIELFHYIPGSAHCFGHLYLREEV